METMLSDRCTRRWNKNLGREINSSARQIGKASERLAGGKEKG